MLAQTCQIEYLLSAFNDLSCQTETSFFSRYVIVSQELTGLAVMSAGQCETCPNGECKPVPKKAALCAELGVLQQVSPGMMCEEIGQPMSC